MRHQLLWTMLTQTLCLLNHCHQWSAMQQCLRMNYKPYRRQPLILSTLAAWQTSSRHTAWIKRNHYMPSRSLLALPCAIHSCLSQTIMTQVLMPVSAHLQAVPVLPTQTEALPLLQVCLQPSVSPRPIQALPCLQHSGQLQAHQLHIPGALQCLQGSQPLLPGALQCLQGMLLQPQLGLCMGSRLPGALALLIAMQMSCGRPGTWAKGPFMAHQPPIWHSVRPSPLTHTRSGKLLTEAGSGCCSPTGAGSLLGLDLNLVQTLSKHLLHALAASG